MDLILCHLTADFDTLGTAVGISRLRPGSRIVLAGDCHPAVRDFLALHRDEYSLIERRSVTPDRIRSLTVVDTQMRDRLGPLAPWLDLGCPITVYDHHLSADSDIVTSDRHVDAVGAATTFVAEQLQSMGITLTPIEATVMALGIHVDTGSLTFDHTTVRDAAALTWLMAQGAAPRVLSEYVEPGLSPILQDLLPEVLQAMQSKIIEGVSLAWSLLAVDAHIPGLSSLVSRVMSVAESDIFILATYYPQGDGGTKINLIGRSRSGSFGTAHLLAAVDLGSIFRELGGGGHPKAAAATVNLPFDQENSCEYSPDKVEDGLNDPPVRLRVKNLVVQIVAKITVQLPQPPTALTLMSSPVRTIQPEVTIGEAHRILLRYGHSGLSVVDGGGHLVGVISRRDLDIALHHNFSHAPVKGFMTTTVKTITPDTSLPDIESLMVTYDIGRLPVLDGNDLVGIVTRTDVLRQLHQQHTMDVASATTNILQEPAIGSPRCPLPQAILARLQQHFVPELWALLNDVATQAAERGWQLYLVGGAVRDLWLATTDSPLLIPDIDLVVDGCHHTDTAAGVALARTLCDRYPNARLQVHGRFQTAAVLWHNDPVLQSLWLDIATARTEFYPYPAANPEVEASSIRQDLYRRDFSINALAIRLTPPRQGELLDFFGGVIDLDARYIRVLHANSFIEDPTRIFRAVRFAVRLGFTLEPQTRRYIEHAIASGIYQRIQTEMAVTPALQTRLRKELQHILAAPYWRTALQLLNELDALQCIHAQLSLTPKLWWKLRLVHRWLHYLDSNHHLPHWLMLLEVLIADLPAPYPKAVAEKLQLPATSIQRLAEWKAHCSRVQQALLYPENSRLRVVESKFPDSPLLHSHSAEATSKPTPVRLSSRRSLLPPCPSQIVSLLQSYDRPTLILIGISGDRPLRRIIWRYLTYWSKVKAPLDGNDLKALGYRPGPEFKAILEHLLAATLDGHIETVEDGKTFLKQTFPLS